MAKRHKDKCSLLYAFYSLVIVLKIFKLQKQYMHATANITIEINFYLVTYYICEVMLRLQSE